VDAAAFDYPLPPAAIAQVPVEPRSAARLLVDRGPAQPPGHSTVATLPDLVGPGDLVVVNDSRVRRARLQLQKPTGGAVEVLLVHRSADGGWEALVRPSGRVRPGTVLTPPGRGSGDLRVIVGDDLGEGRRRVRVEGDHDAHGEVPLPPYIRRPLADPERYQTVYADRPSSVAAPTAGLHLTHDVLDRCRARGAAVAAVELAVGLGTFRPITTARVADHRMHTERYRVAPEVLAASAAAARVVAVGTTVVRALESAATTGKCEGDTDLFIHGDHRFEVVDILLTNFHTPRSSLLALVDAFIGPRWRTLYATALAEGYRFLSFGDAMLIDRRWGRR
jgi:S-adenosylmethionine:tRNA ribosyltransferase-isomerase